MKVLEKRLGCGEEVGWKCESSDTFKAIGALSLSGQHGVPSHLRTGNIAQRIRKQLPRLRIRQCRAGDPATREGHQVSSDSPHLLPRVFPGRRVGLAKLGRVHERTEQRVLGGHGGKSLGKQRGRAIDSRPSEPWLPLLPSDPGCRRQSQHSGPPCRGGKFP